MGLLPREMRENKVYSFLAIWMGGSMVSQMLVKSNAFEVYKGQDLVWSSLKKGRTPNFNDIVSGFAKVGVEIIPPQRRFVHRKAAEIESLQPRQMFAESQLLFFARCALL